MQTRNLIGGEWVGALSGAEFDVVDPATDEVIARAPDCGAAETARAIEGAAAAQRAWREVTAGERAAALRAFADLMRRDRDRLGALMTREQGKPLAEARGEIDYAASFLEWSGEEAKRLYGETIPASARDKRILVLRQPVGVACAITPWNFPSAMITRKLGPALACGCAMVVKPAEDTPLSAIALAELGLEAGLPPALFSVVTGDAAKIGGAMLAHPLVRALSFTGSTEVGRVLMRGGSERIVRMSLELGGHAPFIVFEDADVDRAVEAAVANKLRNGGQTCICANRFLVHESVREAFVSGLVREMGEIRVGHGVDEASRVGPLINDAAVEKVERHVRDALEKGATLRCGGERVRPGPGLADRFYAPTVLEGVTGEMLVSREETFGPVAPVRTFTDEDEAVSIANDSEYGLAAYFFTRDASRLMRVAEALEFGVVGANDALPSTAQAPFGGVKQSGLGREGGRHGMDEYTEVKYVSWGL